MAGRERSDGSDSSSEEESKLCTWMGEGGEGERGEGWRMGGGWEEEGVCGSMHGR